MKFKPNKKRTPGVITNVDGIDILHLFHGFAKNATPDKLGNRSRDRYVKIERVEASGRSVLVEVQSGIYGEEGRTYDVQTHEVSHKRTPGESATTFTRIVAVVAPGSDTAIFMIERQGSQTGGTDVLDSFKSALLSHYPDHFFPTETVVEDHAWLEAASLASVSVVAYSYPVDIADGLTPLPEAQVVLTQTIKPAPGASFFSRAFWAALRNKRVNAATIFGMPDGTEPDSVVVELAKDGQTKKFEIGKEKSPSIRIVITNDGEQYLVNTDFRDRCFKEAKKHYADVGVTWDDKWRTTQWSPEDLKVKLDA